MKTIKRLAEDALLVQDAVNLSGVARSFADALSDLWQHATAQGEGTAWVNSHPVAVLFSSKISSLTRSEDSACFAKAYEEVKKLSQQG